MPLIIRKKIYAVEEILHEGGPVSEQPLIIGAAAVVITNPFAGKYVEDIQYFMEELKPLGLMMSRALIKLLGNDTSTIDGFGKGAIVSSRH